MRRFLDAAGKLRHAEVRIDDTVVMLADPVPPDWPRSRRMFSSIYVSDVKKEDEHKRGGVQDAGATTWWIATRHANH